MARRIGAPRSFVITSATGVDMVNADGDVPTGMLCPGDSATVVRVSYTMKTAGTGSEDHDLDLEHGLGSAGVALTPTISVLADASAGAIVSGDGLVQDAQPNTVEGTQIQVKNVEGGAISNGAILDISVLWEL